MYLTKACANVTGIIDKTTQYYNYFQITKTHECYRNGKFQKAAFIGKCVFLLQAGVAGEKGW